MKSNTLTPYVDNSIEGSIPTLSAETTKTSFLDNSIEGSIPSISSTSYISKDANFIVKFSDSTPSNIEIHTHDDIRRNLLESLNEHGFTSLSDNRGDGKGVAGEVLIMKYNGDSEEIKSLANGNPLIIKLLNSKRWEILTYRNTDRDIFLYGYKLGLLSELSDINSKYHPRKLYIDIPDQITGSQGITFKFMDEHSVIHSGIISWYATHSLGKIPSNLDLSSNNEEVKKTLSHFLFGLLNILHNNTKIELFNGLKFLDNDGKNALQTYVNEVEVISNLSKYNIQSFPMPNVDTLILDKNVSPVILNECIYSNKEMTETKTLNAHMSSLGKNLVTKYPVSITCLLEMSRPFRSAKTAIDCIHQFDYIHADAAGRNFMMTPNKTVKIIDFGTAIKISEPKNGETFHPGFMNTPASLYNQASTNLNDNKQRLYGFQTDLFSFRILNLESLAMFLGHPEKTITTEITTKNLDLHNCLGLEYFNKLSQFSDKERLDTLLKNLLDYSNSNDNKFNNTQLNKFISKKKLELIDYYLSAYKNYILDFPQERDPHKFKEIDTKLYYQCSVNEILQVLKDVEICLYTLNKSDISIILDEAEFRANMCLKLGLKDQADKILGSSGYKICDEFKKSTTSTLTNAINRFLNIYNICSKPSLSAYIIFITSILDYSRDCVEFGLNEIVATIKKDLEDSSNYYLSLMQIKMQEVLKNGNDNDIVKVRREVIQLTNILANLGFKRKITKYRESDPYVGIKNKYMEIKQQTTDLNLIRKKNSLSVTQKRSTSLFISHSLPASEENKMKIKYSRSTGAISNKK